MAGHTHRPTTDDATNRCNTESTYRNKSYRLQPTTPIPMNDGYDRPSEMEYRHYHGHVETSAEVALNKLDEYPEDFANLHEAVESAIRGDRLVTTYGYSLMTVLLSDQRPDTPDYAEHWALYADLSDSRPSYGGVITAMAYVCYQSDVFRKAKRMMEDDDE